MHGEQTGLPLLVVRPGGRQWYSLDERLPLQALLQAERLTGRDVGEGQGCDEQGKAEMALLAAVLDFLRSTHVGGTAPPVEGNWTARRKRRRRRWLMGRSKRSSAALA